MSERLLTVEEFAARTRQHKETIRRQIRRGTLATVRTGHKYLIPESLAQLPSTISQGQTAPEKSTPSNSTNEDVVISREEAKANGFGFLKGQVSSDAFLEEKHAQARLERERDERRQTAKQEVVA